MRHCDRCDKSVARFASPRHTVCLSCEAQIMRDCKACGESKPLTQYYTNVHGYKGHRLPTCKACILKHKADGEQLGAVCSGCGERIYNNTKGAVVYCDACKASPKRQTKQPDTCRPSNHWHTVLYSKLR